MKKMEQHKINNQEETLTGEQKHDHDDRQNHDHLRLKAHHRRHITEFIIIMGILAMILLTVACVAYFRSKIVDAGIQGNSTETYYDKHYVLIADNPDDPIWDSIYEGCKIRGAENGIYVESFGTDLPVEYSVPELLRIAIDSSVDGIIVAGDDSSETIELINAAVDQYIPVVTVLSDSMSSLRQCFVGISNYSLGEEYGKQAINLLELDKRQKIYVLLDSGSGDTSKNTLFLGLKDTIQEQYADSSNVEIQAIAVDENSPFLSEETIRTLMLDEGNLPDVLVCLNAVDTRCAYQAAVDYNKVGIVEILGYYDSEAILNAVDKKIIYSTISVDGVQMGIQCIDALSEYEETGYVSGYLPVNTNVINHRNVGYYLGKVQKNEETQ